MLGMGSALRGVHALAGICFCTDVASMVSFGLCAEETAVIFELRPPCPPFIHTPFHLSNLCQENKLLIRPQTANCFDFLMQRLVSGQIEVKKT